MRYQHYYRNFPFLTSLIMEYGHVFLADILAGQFNCDKPYLAQVVETVNELWRVPRVRGLPT